MHTHIYVESTFSSTYVAAALRWRRYIKEGKIVPVEVTVRLLMQAIEKNGGQLRTANRAQFCRR